MKKKFLVGMMLALVFALSGCGSIESTDNDTNVSTTEKKENKKEADKESDENDLVRSENVYLWASKIRTGTPKELSGLNSKITTLPVTEDSLNSIGEYEAKLSREAFNCSFSEMLDYIWSDNLGYPHKWEEHKIYLVNDNDTKLTYHTHNINNDDLTFYRDMFDQGYWCLETLLDEYYEHKIWDGQANKWDRFDYYLEELGSPSYIRILTDDVERIKNEGAKYFDNIIDEKFEKYNNSDEEDRIGFVQIYSYIQLV